MLTSQKELLERAEAAEAEVTRLRRFLAQLSTRAGMTQDERLSIVARALGEHDER